MYYCRVEAKCEEVGRREEGKRWGKDVEGGGEVDEDRDGDYVSIFMFYTIYNSVLLVYLCWAIAITIA